MVTRLVKPPVTRVVCPCDACHVSVTRAVCQCRMSPVGSDDGSGQAGEGKD